MSELKIHVGESLDDMGRRFVKAWHRAETGDAAPERHLSFDSFETLTRVLTPKRLQLLRHVHNRPSASVAALAREIGRDYKRVHQDVEALSAAGLIERDSSGAALVAPYDTIQTMIAL
ncbi:MarR family transcriptional regulator [Phenylobacterium sp.]|uniref:HVO_A0114 family putative DNA-binding protein n=1 Tax=Phenylobacterium sp. TaxID=1871053 RepID=UPI00286E63C7|nr:MarR family transcriptional regulator [Phenylobacterium sp.]